MTRRTRLDSHESLVVTWLTSLITQGLKCYALLSMVRVPKLIKGILMKKMTLAALFFATLSAPVMAVTAFKTGEQVTGQTKQCYYKFGMNTYTITKQSYELCPLSINV